MTEPYIWVRKLGFEAFITLLSSDVMFFYNMVKLVADTIHQYIDLGDFLIRAYLQFMVFSRVQKYGSFWQKNT